MTWVLYVRTGHRVSDLSPSMVIRSAVLHRLATRALNDPQTRIVERPVRFRRRAGGKSKVSGQVSASLAAGRAMLSVAMAESGPRPVLALMAKAPRDGHAKTRLAADIGLSETRALWAACLADGAASLGASGRALMVRTVVVVPEARDKEPVEALLDDGWDLAIQQRPGLSGGLIECFLRAFDAGATSAFAVGADSPTLPRELIAMAALPDAPRLGELAARGILEPTSAPRLSSSSRRGLARVRGSPTIGSGPLRSCASTRQPRTGRRRATVISRKASCASLLTR